jgi:hypothetical protein
VVAVYFSVSYAGNMEDAMLKLLFCKFIRLLSTAQKHVALKFVYVILHFMLYFPASSFSVGIFWAVIKAKFLYYVLVLL